LLIQTAIRRIMGIAQDHCGWRDEAPAEHPEKRRLIQAAESIEILRYNAGWTKVKIRNKPGKLFGGLTGAIVYEGDFTPFWPVLDAAVILDIGRGTTYGFGQISFQQLNDVKNNESEFPFQ